MGRLRETNLVLWLWCREGNTLSGSFGSKNREVKVMRNHRTNGPTIDIGNRICFVSVTVSLYLGNYRRSKRSNKLKGTRGMDDWSKLRSVTCNEHAKNKSKVGTRTMKWHFCSITFSKRKNDSAIFAMFYRATACQHLEVLIRIVHAMNSLF